MINPAHQILTICYGPLHLVLMHKVPFAIRFYVPAMQSHPYLYQMSWTDDATKLGLQSKKASSGVGGPGWVEGDRHDSNPGGTQGISCVTSLFSECAHLPWAPKNLDLHFIMHVLSVSWNLTETALFCDHTEPFRDFTFRKWLRQQKDPCEFSISFSFKSSFQRGILQHRDIQTRTGCGNTDMHVVKYK